jgi:hypothetical protein
VLLHCCPRRSLLLLLLPQLVYELRDVLDVKHFINNKLGISDRQVRTRSASHHQYEHQQQQQQQQHECMNEVRVVCLHSTPA